MATLVVILNVPDVDPTLEDPHEIAQFVLEGDPVPVILGAEWADGSPAITAFVGLWTP